MEWTTDAAFSNIRGNVVSNTVNTDIIIRDLLTQGSVSAIADSQEIKLEQYVIVKKFTLDAGSVTSFTLFRDGVSGTHYIHITTTTTSKKYLTINLKVLTTQEGTNNIIVPVNVNTDPVIFLKIENGIVKVI